MRACMYLIGLAGMLLQAAAPAQAEYLDTMWTQNYWNGYFDSVNCIQQTSDGGFIMTGVNLMEGEIHNDIYLVKTDQAGDQQWAKIIGDTLNDCGFHVLQTWDGGYLISAQSDAPSAGYGKIWIIKTDAAGDTVWTYYLLEPDGNGFPLCATQTFDSGYAITGVINISYDNKAFILKLSKDGHNQGFYTYSEYSHQDGTFIGQLADSGFVVGGNFSNPYSTQYDFWAFRTDMYGNKLWDSLYAITDYTDIVYGGCMVEDGMVMVGLARSAAHAHKVDFNGNTVWSKSISKEFTNEKSSCVCPSPDGGLMVGGWIWVTGHRRDYSFLKLNADGDTLYSYTVGGANDDHARSIVPTSDGGYAMVGTSSSFVNGTSFYLVKVSDAPCGDADGDGGLNIGDCVAIINYIFKGGPAPDPLCIADTDNDGGITVGDVVQLIIYIFKYGPVPQNCCL